MWTLNRNYKLPWGECYLGGYKAVHGISLCFLFFLILLLVGPAFAIEVQIDGELPEAIEEKQIIDCVLTISGIPNAADYIHFDTDLGKYKGEPVYNFTDLNISGDDGNFVLPVNPDIKSVKVKLKGQIPAIKVVRQYEGITLVKYNPKRTGYAYYRISLTDEDGNSIKDSDTRTFTILAPEVNAFRNNIAGIEDPVLNSYLQDLFDKGLVEEANELANHLNDKKNSSTVSEKESKQFSEKLIALEDPFLDTRLLALFKLGLDSQATELADYLIQEKKDVSTLKWIFALGLIVALVAGFVLGVKINSSDEDEGEDDLL